MTPQAQELSELVQFEHSLRYQLIRAVNGKTSVSEEPDAPSRLSTTKAGTQ